LKVSRPAERHAKEELMRVLRTRRKRRRSMPEDETGAKQPWERESGRRLFDSKSNS